jgi:hypothetical protein
MLKEHVQDAGGLLLPSKLEFLRFSPRALVLQTFDEGSLCLEAPCSYNINGVLKLYLQGIGGPNLYTPR